MKNIIELERKTAQLGEDIRDVLHAAQINLQATMGESGQVQPCLPSEFAYLHSLLLALQRLIEERPQLQMGFLITRVIQEEEERVRRERLADYEDKIYDQRRIISDKEAFFESLLRPKKKRLPTQTADEFQEQRARERDAEERSKIEVLTRELSDLQALKRFVEAQERDACFRQKMEAKNCSLSVVNSTALSDNGDFPTDQAIPITELALKKESSHQRTNSLQHSILRDSLAQTEEGKPQDPNIPLAVAEVYALKAENEELHRIYDQQCLTLKFKKAQCSKAQREYQAVAHSVTEARKQLQKAREQERWRHERCFAPAEAVLRSSSIGRG